MKITKTKLRRMIRKVIVETVTGHEQYVNLLYTIRPVGQERGSAGTKEHKKIYSLELEPGEQLTPERIMDFWYEQNSFYGRKTETHVPIAAQAIETQGAEFDESGMPTRYGKRVPVGPVFDLEDLI